MRREKNLYLWSPNFSVVSCLLHALKNDLSWSFLVKSTGNCMTLAIFNVCIMELPVDSAALAIGSFAEPYYLSIVLSTLWWLWISIFSLNFLYKKFIAKPQYFFLAIWLCAINIDVTCGQYGLHESVIFVSLCTEHIAHCYHALLSTINNTHCYHSYHCWQ